MGFKVYFTKLDLSKHTDLMYTPLDSFVFFTYTNYLEDYIRNENNNIFISLKNYLDIHVQKYYFREAYSDLA